MTEEKLVVGLGSCHSSWKITDISISTGLRRCHFIFDGEGSRDCIRRHAVPRRKWIHQRYGRVALCRTVTEPLRRLSNGSHLERLEAIYCRSRNAGDSSHAYWKRV